MILGRDRTVPGDTQHLIRTCAAARTDERRGRRRWTAGGGDGSAALRQRHRRPHRCGFFDSAPGRAQQHVAKLSTRGDAAAQREGLEISLACSIVGPFTSLVAKDSEQAVQKLKLNKGRLVRLDTGLAYEIASAKTTFGRHPSNDVLLLDQSVSRQHFVLVATAAGFRLRDTTSTKHTFVDGRKTRDALLQPGSLIQVGVTELKRRSEPGAAIYPRLITICACSARPWHTA